MPIGEAGTITTNSPGVNTPITVTLTEPLTDPVFALTATNDGGDPFVLRITDQTIDGDGNTTSFTFILEEWEYLDGAHPATETINWLAIEEGVHTLPDGRVIEAGTVSADNTNTAVSLNGDFDDPPVVLTSVMSENDTTTVDSDPLNITMDGFNVRLQEEEGEDGVHAAETVGYIAIQAGGDADSGAANTFGGLVDEVNTFTLGDTFDNAIVLAETQTINGPDPANVAFDAQSNSDVDLFIQEEQSNDGETSHIPETVGVVAFENGLIPCFTRGTLISTPQGDMPVESLEHGSMVCLYDGGMVPLSLRINRKIALSDLEKNPNMRPIRISAGALGSDLPKRDLLVSPQHRMLIRSSVAARMFNTSEVLISAHRLTVLPGIFVDLSIEEVEYIHLIFEVHQVILAEGTPTESFYPGPEALKTMPAALLEEFQCLFPDYIQQQDTIPPARQIPPGRRQKALIQRMVKNHKPALEPSQLRVG